MGTKKVFIFSISAIICLLLLWPGDAPFINDEPNLLISAYQANTAHKLAEAGIIGTVGLRYGPLPTWIYQVIISISSTPEIWILLRTSLMLASILLGLFLLARAAGFWKWFIPIVMLSPYLWFYSRQLWDNSFLLAFSTLAMGGYAYFLYSSTKSERLITHLALLLSITAALILPFIHFMAVPLSITLFAHMSIYSRKYLWKVRFAIITILFIFTIAHLPYLRLLFDSLKNIQPHETLETSDYWMGWFFPLLGGRILSGTGLNYFFGNNWLPTSPLYLFVQGITCFAFILVFVGIFIAGKNLYGKRNIFKKIDSKKTPLGIQAHLSMIALVSLILQVIVCGITHSFFHPHYYSGLWIIYVVLAWFAVDEIRKKNWGKILISGYAISLAIVLIIIVLLVHKRGGTRGVYYGPTIANQFDISRKIGSHNRTDISSSVPNFVYFSSLTALHLLSVTDDRDRINGPLVIEYANGDTLSGFVRVIQKPE